MIQNYGQRLARWRNSQSLTQRGLGSVLGVSQGYISDIEAGRSEPSRAFLQKLTERFAVSADWILFGTGLPTTQRAAGFTTESGLHRIDPPDLGKPMHGDFVYAGEDFSMIARNDLSVSAGTGVEAVDGEVAESMAFSRAWLMRHRITPNLAALVRVKGDSMAPTIPDGALVLVNFAERSITAEAIFAFIRAGEAFIKRIAPLEKTKTDRPKAVVILSDNPAFAPIVVSGEAMNDIRIIGRVRSVMFSV